MDLLETVNLATEEIKRNKTRSFLTMLGIIIGVFAVITLISVGTGLKAYINKQFETLGSNVLYVLPGQVGGEDGGFGAGGGPPNFSGSKLKSSMIKDIQKLGDPIVGVTGDVEIPANAKFQNKQKRVTVIGTTEEIALLTSLEIVKGRFFNLNDVSNNRKVAVIGSEVVNKFFSTTDPLEKEIIVSEARLRVVGTLATKGGGLFGGAADSTVYVPITVAQSIFGTNSLQTIIIKFSDQSKLNEVKLKVSTYLLKRLKQDDFSLVNQASILSTISSILNVLTIALGGIAAISLLVGGIGIMNIMLVSVTERTREIGIRKSVGARNKDILAQFIVEAVFLSLVGGIIGTILGIFGALAIGRLISANAITIWSIVLALGVSSAVGIIFGVAPAAKAARMNPVEALRYE